MEAKQLGITDESFIQPLNQVLVDITPKLPQSESRPNEPAKSLQESLDTLFPEQQREEKNLQKAKEILGPVAIEFTSEQLKETIVEVQFLVESWLDDFEREVFGGQTLKELLHEKGGL